MKMTSRSRLQLDLVRPHLHQLVEVGWVDSCSTDNIWENADYMFGDCGIYTAGYFVRREPGLLVIAQSWHTYGQSYRYGRLFCIPIGCITSFRKVKL